MGNPSVMKSFLNFFREARTSQASDTAARQNLTGDGHGNWFDKDGNGNIGYEEFLGGVRGSNGSLAAAGSATQERTSVVAKARRSRC